LEKLLDWFKEKKSNPILKEAKDKTTTGGRNLFEETRQKMVALRATAFSIDFRANYLPSFFRESFQYHEETITEKAEELEEFLNSPEENITLQISTKSLRCTTVKILSALDTLPRFKNSDDGYLLIESEHLERNKHMKEWVQGAMNEDKSHQVLVVIGETPVQVGSYEKELMPKDTQLRKKMIFICSDGLATQFEELFDSMENSDVIFKIGGRPFPAHKLILVTRCQVFAAMFKHDTKEKLSSEIEIKDVEPDVFQQLLRFIYTGRLSLATMETMAVALFIAADKYLLDQLKDKCELFLLNKMTPVNCLELLLQADFLILAKLKEEAAGDTKRA
jgi:speckle-type POZ protein